MSKVTVTGQIVANNGITLFFADGTSKVLPSDSWQTQEILEQILPDIIRDNKAEIDLDNYSLQKKVEAIAGNGTKINVQGNGVSVEMKNGKIENAAALMPHIEDAVYGAGAKGFKRFMQSLDEMIKKRSYAATELLEHMKHGDLPIADDGCLIGYKILAGEVSESRGGPLKPGYMVDHHTWRVKQRLGSLVYMPESKVDQSRQLCSTGLHIASRRYLSSFWQSHSRLCLVKIKPKDVVSVPLDEATKMRVSAYHIVAVFSEELGQQIVNGNKIESIPEAHRILANVVAGNHPPILETVEVTGNGEFKVKVLEKVQERKHKKPRLFGRARPVLNPKAVKAKVKKLKSSITDKYQGKLAKAQAFLDKGKSIRWIAKKLGMDRESLGKNLKR